MAGNPPPQAGGCSDGPSEQSSQFLDRLLAAERPLNIPTTIQSACDCVRTDVQPPPPISNAGGNTIPGDNSGSGMVDAGLALGSPIAVCLAPAPTRVTGDEHQAAGAFSHISQEPLESLPLAYTPTVLHLQIAPSASSAV